MNTSDDPRDAIRALKELVRRIECGEYRITRFAVRKTNEREAYVANEPVSMATYDEGPVSPMQSDVRYREGIGFEVAVMETYDARDGRRPVQRGNIFDPPIDRYQTKVGPQRDAWNRQYGFNVADELARERVAEAQRESASRAAAEIKRVEAAAKRAAKAAAKKAEEEAEAARRGKPFGARDLDID